MKTVEQRAERIVRQEVICCVSALVCLLAKSSDNGALAPAYLKTIAPLFEQAAELAAPIDDYEEAAIQEGWSLYETELDRCLVFKQVNGAGNYCDEQRHSTWGELCEFNGIEPYQRRVFEHWAVSDRLGRKLEAEGEKVDFNFAGLVVWPARVFMASLSRCSTVTAGVRNGQLLISSKGHLVAFLRR